MAFIYSELEDIDRALEYCYKVIEYSLSVKDVRVALGTYINFGDFYLRKNQLDSARYYNNKAFDIAEKFGESDIIQTTSQPEENS